MSEFPTYHFFVQHSFLENIRYMLTNRCPSFIKQLSYLSYYIQPYRFILQSNIKFYPLVRLIDNHLTQIQALRIPVIWSKSFPVKIILTLSIDLFLSVTSAIRMKKTFKHMKKNDRDKWIKLINLRWSFVLAFSHLQ